MIKYEYAIVKILDFNVLKIKDEFFSIENALKQFDAYQDKNLLLIKIILDKRDENA